MQYKPLSELAKDEEACRRIAEHLRIFKHRVSDYKDYVSISGRDSDGAFSGECWVTVHFNGNVNLIKLLKQPNVFALVDLIRELGYSPS